MRRQADGVLLLNFGTHRPNIAQQTLRRRIDKTVRRTRQHTRQLVKDIPHLRMHERRSQLQEQPPRTVHPWIHMHIRVVHEHITFACRHRLGEQVEDHQPRQKDLSKNPTCDIPIRSKCSIIPRRTSWWEVRTKPRRVRNVCLNAVLNVARPE